MPAAIPIIAGFTGVSAAIGGTVAAAIGLGTVGTLAATAIGSGIIAGGITAFQGGDAGDVLRSAVLGGATSYIGGSIGEMFGGVPTDTLTDAQFIAADAAQLAQQGLGPEQIAYNLSSYGVNESLASQIALDAFTGMNPADIAAGYGTANLFNATAGMGIIKPDGSRYVIPDDWKPVSTGQGWVDSNGYIFDATGTMVDFAQYPQGDWLTVDANGVATIKGPTNLFRDVPRIDIAAPTLPTAGPQYINLQIPAGAEAATMLRGDNVQWSGSYNPNSGQYFDPYGNPINSPFNTDTGMQVVSNSTGEVLMSDAIATGVPTPEIVSTPLPPLAPPVAEVLPPQTTVNDVGQIVPVETVPVVPEITPPQTTVNDVGQIVPVETVPVAPSIPEVILPQPEVLPPQTTVNDVGQIVPVETVPVVPEVTLPQTTVDEFGQIIAAEPAPVAPSIPVVTPPVPEVLPPQTTVNDVGQIVPVETVPVVPEVVAPPPQTTVDEFGQIVPAETAPVTPVAPVTPTVPEFIPEQPPTPAPSNLPPVEDAIPSYVNPNPTPPMTLPEAIYDVGGALVDRYGVTNVAGGVLAGGALINNAINPPTTPVRGPYQWSTLPPLTYGTGDLPALVNPGLNPGQIRATPYYQTTDPVQSQYYWGQRPYMASAADLANYNVIPDAPAQPFGIRQSRPALDVPQFIRQNINPTTQAAYMGAAPVAPVAPVNINPLTGLPYTAADLVAPVAP